MKKLKSHKLIIISLIICLLFAGCSPVDVAEEAAEEAAEETVEADRIEPEREMVMVNTTFPFFEEEELMARAALIVYGRVVRESNPFWIECYFGSRTLYRDFYIKPYEILRGETTLDEVVVRIRGGETEDLIYMVTHSPNFQIGEKYLLFLAGPCGSPFDTPGDYFYIIGGSQGVFEVEEPPSGFDRNDEEIIFEQVTGSFEFTLTALKEELEEINETVPIRNEEDLWQEAIDNFRGNMERGVFVWDAAALEEMENRPLRPARIIEIE